MPPEFNSIAFDLNKLGQLNSMYNTGAIGYTPQYTNLVANTSTPVQSIALQNYTPSSLSGGYTPASLSVNLNPETQAALQSSATWGKVFGGLNTAMNVFSSIYGLINANKQLKMAREAYNFNKSLSQRNLSNSVTDYNRRLSAKVHRAGAWNGDSSASQEAYINQHKLSDKL